jgi:hypothetical protein
MKSSHLSKIQKLASKIINFVFDVRTIFVTFTLVGVTSFCYGFNLIFGQELTFMLIGILFVLYSFLVLRLIRG